MDKIHIVTVQNSLNYGAYLQAYSLSNFLRDEFNKEVYFVKTNSRHPYIDTIKQVIKAMIKLNINKALYMIKLLFKYKKGWKEFKISRIKDVDKTDTCITGSDEIWHIHRKAFLDYPIFFGAGIKASKRIAYAPSCNITSLEEFKIEEWIKGHLEKYTAIAVRDDHTQKVISTFLDNKVEKVVDPTLLRDINYYYGIEKQLNTFNNYILVYGDNNFTEEQITEVKRFAQENQLKLIAAGLYLEWCDLNISASPMEFLGLIHNAAYIITTTFHGSVFSIIYKKQFVVYAGKKIKVMDLLKEFELEDRNMTTHVGLEKRLKATIDYNKVGKRIENKRDSSIKYLLNAMDK